MLREVAVVVPQECHVATDAAPLDLEVAQARGEDLEARVGALPADRDPNLRGGDGCLLMVRNFAQAPVSSGSLTKTPA